MHAAASIAPFPGGINIGGEAARRTTPSPESTRLATLPTRNFKPLRSLRRRIAEGHPVKVIGLEKIIEPIETAIVGPPSVSSAAC